MEFVMPGSAPGAKPRVPLWHRAWRVVLLFVIPLGLAIVAVAGSLATYHATLAAEGHGTKGYFVSVDQVHGEFRLPDGRVTRPHVIFADPTGRLRPGAIIPALDTGDVSHVFARHGSRYWEVDASILAFVLGVLGLWVWLVPVRSRRRRTMTAHGVLPDHVPTRAQHAVGATTLDPNWTTATIALMSGDVSTRRVNTALRKATNRASLPILVIVTVLLSDADRAMSPVSGESARLAELTKTIAGLVGDRGVLAVTMADAGAWAFLIYTGSTDWLQDFQSAVRSAAADHLVSFGARPDRRWRVYRELARLTPHPVRDRILLLAVLPLLFAAFAARYGWLSAAVIFVATEAWTLPISLARRDRLIARQLTHPAAMFPLICGIFVTMLYPLGAVMVHPASPWLCAAGAAAASVVITAAVWPAQLRYYARMRAQRATTTTSAS